MQSSPFFKAAILTVIIVAKFTIQLQAQSAIHGLVINANGKPLQSVNVLLLHNKDSALVKGTISDGKGAYAFNNLTVGNYLLCFSFIGLKQVFRAAAVTGKQDDIIFDTIELIEQSAQLNEVKVETKKPLFEQKIDRLIINVANSITSSGNTALEILERSPGVVVDHQNNLISMNGKDGVVLMINGKINHMPVAALMQWLAGMSAGNMEKIELITTPPANFDAEGNAGYINIALKSNNNFGTNGSYAATVGYESGPVEQASLNLNHRNGRINLYGALSYSRVKTPFPLSAYNRFSNNGFITETYFNAHRTDTSANFNGRLGVDFQVNKKTVIGILLSGNDNRYMQSELNDNLIFKNVTLDTSIKLSNSEINHWKSYSGNINLQHNFSKDENISFNVDYIHYTNNQPVNYLSSYYNASGNFIYDTKTKTAKLTQISFWIGEVDYTKKLSPNLSMEAGIKETVSAFRNDMIFERYNQSAWIRDESLSAKYKLDENYSAAYTSFNILVNKSTNAKIGLRYEYTNSNLESEAVKNIIDRHYGKLFPSFFISHKLNEKNAINFSYSVRITRPSFNNLAPFTYYIDPNTVLTGNPALQPAISNAVKVDYSLKRYLLSLSYSKDDNFITNLQPESDSASNKTILTPKNLINQKTASVIISVPVSVSKWWSMQYNITGLWQQVNAMYKETPLRFAQTNFRINASESFKLPEDWSAELSGFYQSPVLNGIMHRKSFGSLDAGIKKKMTGKKGTLVFSVSDIFNTMTMRGYANLPEQNLVRKVRAQFTLRTFKLTYTRSFGNDKLRDKRERSTGSEDELNRVQQN